MENLENIKSSPKSIFQQEIKKKISNNKEILIELCQKNDLQKIYDIINIDIEKNLNIFEENITFFDIFQCKNYNELLNLNGKIVKYRAFVQNIFNNEILVDFAFDLPEFQKDLQNDNYDGILGKSVFFLKYGGEITENPEKIENKIDFDNNCILKERTPCFCIPIPYENTWFNNIVNQKNEKIDENKENKENFNITFDNLAIDSTENIENLWKKMYEKGLINHYSFGKIPFILHTFNNEKIKLNTVIEGFGILALEKQIKNENLPKEEIEIHDYNMVFPNYIIPRIYNLNFSETTNNNNIMKKLQENTEFEGTEEISQYFLKIFLNICLNNQSAALFLMYFLFKINENEETDKIVINFSRTSQILYKTPEGKEYNFGEILEMIFNKLIPRSCLFPLVLENLEHENFFPLRNFKANLLENLQTGKLQVANNTKIIIDENSLKSGKLNEKSMKNIQDLNTLITKNQIYINFEFYEMNFPVNVESVILSEGKSFLYFDILVPVNLNKKQEIVQLNNKFVKLFIEESKESKNILNEMRYLIFEIGPKIKKVEVSEEISQKIQDDYVELRKKQNVDGDKKPIEKQESIEIDNLKLWMGFARYFAALKSKQKIDWDDYESAKDLDLERIKNLKL